jgi:lipoprotein NlpI
MSKTAGILVVGSILAVLLSTAVAGEDPLALATGKYRSGDYEGALAEAMRVTRQEPDNARAWFLCGMVRFRQLADYPRAIECFDRVIELVSDHDVEFPEVRHAYRNRGMSHFLLGDHEKAEADLASGIVLDPDGIHSRILWYLAATRSGKSGEKSLREFADSHHTGDWPYPVVSLYLGYASPEECLEAAVGDDPEKTRGNLCEAHFYIAEHYLLRGEEDLAAAHFEKCLQTGEARYNEYLMAREELRNLGRDPEETDPPEADRAP